MNEEKELKPEVIQLMGVYLDELKFRDNLLWSQVYKFFYATITVILLPFVKTFLDVGALNFPNWIFNLIGIGMSVFFWVFATGFANRLKAVSETYNEIIDTLPEKYQRYSIDEFDAKKKDNAKKRDPMKKKSISYGIIYILFGSLLLINGLLLVYSFIN